MKDFDLTIPKMGHVMAVRYERPKKFEIFSEGIFQKQLWEGFKVDEAVYTHVAISSGGPHLVNIAPPKAKLIDLLKVYHGKYVKFLRYKGEDFDNHKRYKIACIYNAIASNMGYDYSGILYFLFPRIKQMVSRFFCSEATAEAYKMFYPDFIPELKSYEVMPAHFLASKDFMTVWQGYIPK